VLLPESDSPPEPGSPARAAGLGAGIARGAAVVAALTIFSRLLGLGRTLVFAQTVGASCLGTAYVTANQVPNLLYELILGGALTSAMVPILARSAERAGDDPAEKDRVADITSALLTWTVIIMVPLVLVIVLAAGPIASLLNPANANAHCVRADVVHATSNMLAVFAPQALLYGLSVLLYGLLQSYRRFAASALGPGISSLVLISCYLAFVPLNKGLPLARLPLQAELVLSVGTTLGIAALVVGASSVDTSSLLPTICLSMKSWLRSRMARVSAAMTAFRLRVSSLSCCCSPDSDQLVEPLTVYTPSTITIFRCEIALCTELVPMAMLLPKASLAQLARICFSCTPLAWLRSRLICT